MGQQCRSRGQCEARVEDGHPQGPGPKEISIPHQEPCPYPRGDTEPASSFQRENDTATLAFQIARSDGEENLTRYREIVWQTVASPPIKGNWVWMKINGRREVDRLENV